VIYRYFIKKHPGNIFIHSNDIKLGDFGLSKFIDDSTLSYCKTAHCPRYTDPKFIMDSKYKRTQASDVYSVGVLMWQISSGKEPFECCSGNDFIIMIMRGEREDTIMGTPGFYSDLYKGKS